MGRRGGSSSCAVWFHATVTVVLFVSGGLLLSLGIWQLVTSFGGLSRLNFPTESRFYSTTAASSGLICTVLAPILMLASISGLLALNFSVFRFVFALMAGISFVILCFISVICWALSATYASEKLANVLRAAWNNTPTVTLCKIEAVRKCRAFQLGCQITPGITEKCAQECPNSFDITCYEALTTMLFKVSLPVALVSGIAAFIVAADIFAVFNVDP